MKKPVPDHAADQIDAKAHELMQEFFDHVRQVHETTQRKHDPRKIFEGWAIQKIAALQFTVLQLAEKLNERELQIRGN